MLPYHWELQIHTVMQETWSRVSHAGFYKTKRGIPKQVHQRLLRFASTSRLLDDHLLDLSVSIKAVQDKLGEKFADATVRPKLEIDEYTLWHCQADDIYGDDLRMLRSLGTRAGLQVSAWQSLVEVGDETDICLDVCRRTKITTWGQMKETLKVIGDNRNWWIDILRQLVRRCEQSNVPVPFNRPWLVLSIICLLDFSHMPTIDVMYEPLWMEIEGLQTQVKERNQGGRLGYQTRRSLRV